MTSPSKGESHESGVLEVLEKAREERAGGNELERSESSFPPATPPDEEGPAESRDESFVMAEGQVAESADSSSATEEALGQ